tara:strand:+ start:43 stop:546 length:504 start_codon:yes stop_codon:yes gene_type:complete
MRTILFLFFTSLFAATASADNLDEAAKCAATFKVLTSLRANSEDLGDHFTKQGFMSWDMMGIYAEHERGRVFTNGEISNLVTQYQTELDNQQPNGNAFVPYVRSCTGWTYRIGQIFISEASDQQKKTLLLDPSNNPSLAFEYPHSTWPQMKDLFFEAHRIWIDLVKK